MFVCNSERERERDGLLEKRENGHVGSTWHLQSKYYYLTNLKYSGYTWGVFGDVILIILFKFCRICVSEKIL